MNGRMSNDVFKVTTNIELYPFDNLV